MVDLHMHTKFSDGTDTIEEIIDKWIDNKLTYVSITDHDTIDGVNYLFAHNELQNKLKDNHINFIQGIEFSSFVGENLIHLLGYKYDIQNSQFLSAVEMGRNLRYNKFLRRIDALKEQFGIEFSENSLNEMKEKLDYIGKPIMARYMLKDGICDNLEDCFKLYLNKLKLERIETRVDANVVVPAIVSAKGVCVWAHPLGGIGEERISFEKVEEIINLLIPLGLKGLECYYNMYTSEEIEKLLSIAKKYNLFVSAGSDYHGKNKTVKIGDMCIDKKITVTKDMATVLKI